MRQDGKDPDAPVEFPIGDELDLHTFPAREIRSLVEEYLYQCHLKGLDEVRIIHGKGIGTQRRIVRSVLEQNPRVRSFRDAAPDRGGWGATWVRLKERRPAMKTRIGKTRLTLVQGDITQADTEAIVNAANSSLMGGGGVDGAIHRAGGPKILEECRKIVAEQGRCPTGKAVITSGGRLPARYVIHTVGPVWSGGKRRERELLADAYRNSLNLAKKNGIQSISFPSISTGAYRFPIEEAARIALSTVRRFLEKNELSEVRFVLFSESDLQVYTAALQETI